MPSVGVGGVTRLCRVVVRAHTASEGTTRTALFRVMGAEHAAGPHVVEVGQADTGKFVEEIGLGGADVREVLGACAKASA
ncbi:hypothetical protein [Streptomyces solicathayae]|uniref:Uncharacterized protein n=1 Tax=Streptomyces solicathayae TaxID=3081768 RepID=A0ABZ0LKQ4_9ACTN|nr:hypothetical protein [Streptomyces sp. HUAS YS2]WOX20074.1 hypothetical protein R2D22_01160 [Streptomyces sp. HUAS YS2]